MRYASACCRIGVCCTLLLCSLPSWADRTETNRSTEAFWAQFAVGDDNINVYSHMGRLVLATTNGQHQSTILQWSATHQEFTLFLLNEEITDLTTGEDAHGRPTFAGRYVGGVPSVGGFVDVSPDNTLIVELVTGICATAVTQSQVVSLRYETNYNGVVVGSPGSCDCPVAGSIICCKADCDASPKTKCNIGDAITDRCTWYN